MMIVLDAESLRDLPASPAPRQDRTASAFRGVPARHGKCRRHARTGSGSTALQRQSTASSSARLDLEQRREGDVLGQSQSGRRSQLKLLRLLRDEAVIEDARVDAAIALVAEDPTLERHEQLREAVAALRKTTAPSIWARHGSFQPRDHRHADGHPADQRSHRELFSGERFLLRSSCVSSSEASHAAAEAPKAAAPKQTRPQQQRLRKKRSWRRLPVERGATATACACVSFGRADAGQFRRADTVWLVFDRTGAIDVEASAPRAAPHRR